MSNATFTFGRFNPPTEEGHGKLVSAVQQHAEKTGGEHYIFPSHSQDAKKNPMSHEDKVGAMKKLFPKANVVSHPDVRTALDAMKHLESKGHKHVTMVVGSDRVDEFHGLLNKYREKEYPGIKKVSVVSAGNRDPDAEGAEGMSASKLRGLVAAGKKDEFISHYSNAKVGKEIHDKVKAGMEAAPKKKLKESVGIFLLGGPGSGKDYVLKNIFSRFDLMEVQIDQVLTGAAKNLFEQGTNVVINGGDAEKIQLVKMMYEDYTFDHVFVSVTNKVSRQRNEGLKQPLAESKRIEKFLKAEKMVASFEDAFVFNNSLNLNESSEMEKIFFAAQIEKLLERVVGLGLELMTTPDPKTFTVVKEQGFEPMSPFQKRREKNLARARQAEKQNRVRDKEIITHQNAHVHDAAKGTMEEGLKDACWKGYEAIGTKKKNGKKVPNCVPVKEHIVKVGNKFRLVSKSTGKNLGTYDTKAGAEKRERQVQYFKHMGEATEDKPLPLKLKHLPRSGNITAVKKIQDQNKKAAEDVGAVQEDINTLFEMQLAGTDEYRQHAIAMTPGQTQEIQDATANLGKTENQDQSSEGCGCSGNCGCGGACRGECSCEGCGGRNASPIRGLKELRSKISEAKKAKVTKVGEDGVDFTPTVKTKRASTALKAVGKGYDSTMSGVPITSTGTGYYNTTGMTAVEEQADDNHAMYHEFAQFCCDHHGLEEAPTLNLHDDPEWTTQNGTFGHYTPSTNTINLSITGRHPMDIMRTLAHEITHAYQNSQSPLPPEAGETGSDWENHANAEAGVIMRKWRDVKPEAFKAMMESATLSESVEYHLQNKISFTENVFRPGSENFFAMISEAKRLYAEGKYKPVDEYEQDLLESNVGEKAIYEGKEVILDFPFQETLNEDDETGGHGIGKPFRSHGGGAVYVKNSKGNVIKVNFSQSGMKKRYNEPGRVRSFIARHHCLTNKDRTSASYWACRWPRYFSDTGQQWW